MKDLRERIETLKKNFYYKDTIIKEHFVKHEVSKEISYARPEYRPGMKICIERGRLITESYMETEGEPEIIRRAKAVSHIMDNMTIYILEGELVVGNFATNPWSLPIYPEVQDLFATEESSAPFKDSSYIAKVRHNIKRGDAILQELEERNIKTRDATWYMFTMLDGKESEYKKICSYWANKSMRARLRLLIPYLPEDMADWMTYGFFNGVCWSGSGFGGAKSSDGGNMEKILKIGYGGIEIEIEEAKARLKKTRGELTWDEYVEREETLEAFMISIRGMKRFIKRYADLAKKMADGENNKSRKDELKTIEEGCNWMSKNPPQTLQQAMQLLFTTDLVYKTIAHQGQGLGYRFDVLLNPFYQSDIEKGIITREKAVELMACLLFKVGEKGHLNPPEVSLHYEGMTDVKVVIIGGVTPEGDDATNDFSFVILDAAKEVQLPEPSTGIRYHPKISQELIYKAIDVIRTGLGHPMFFNDSAAIPYYMSMGFPIEQARTYGVTSCVIGGILDGTHQRPIGPNSGTINLLSCLEMALYQGWSPFLGEQLGPKTRDPSTFTSTDEVMDAYLAQVHYFMDKLAKNAAIGIYLCEKYAPRPYFSLLLNGCIERGKDCTRWSDFSYPNVLCTGQTNVANSMAVIKKFVFDEKLLSMEELIEACRTNWKGKEKLRQRVISEVPKFGNDDDYVDMLARDVHIRTNAECMKIKDKWGGRYQLNGSIAGGYHGASRGCGATPDGRRAWEPSADAVISPAAGTDKKGPTAVLKSVGKVTPTYFHLLNQKFMPKFLEGENKKIFAQFLKTWADLGIYHIQFNVVDKAVLEAAQRNPENYAGLIVRVAGYSAYFVNLSEPLQNDIIMRSEQTFG